MERALGPIARPIRIEPAFDNRENVRAMFERNAPYAALGVQAPDGVEHENNSRASSVLPWFRGNWAVAGKILVRDADTILWNERFMAAAREAFDAGIVRPKTVVVNINAPMVAGAPHIDVPSFRGATREHYPLSFLMAMGESGLFERWRVVEAGAVSWFYDGPGGEFDYWPDGLSGPVRSESAPFGNVAIVADNDRMYHRIGAVGESSSKRARISAAVQISPSSNGSWVIKEDGRIVDEFPAGAVRLSVLWKAEIFANEAAERIARTDMLTIDQVVDLFVTDLRNRGVEVDAPNDPLRDEAWISLLRRTYYRSPAAGRL